jgi:hypothetical protein
MEYLKNRYIWGAPLAELTSAILPKSRGDGLER